MLAKRILVATAPEYFDILYLDIGATIVLKHEEIMARSALEIFRIFTRIVDNNIYHFLIACFDFADRDASTLGACIFVRIAFYKAEPRKS